VCLSASLTHEPSNGKTWGRNGQSEDAFGDQAVFLATLAHRVIASLEEKQEKGKDEGYSRGCSGHGDGLTTAFQGSWQGPEKTLWAGEDWGRGYKGGRRKRGRHHPRLSGILVWENWHRSFVAI